MNGEMGMAGLGFLKILVSRNGYPMRKMEKRCRGRENWYPIDTR